MKEYKTLNIKDLEFSNLRDIRQHTVEQIKKSIENNGYIENRLLLVVPSHSEEKYIVAGGNHRLQALLELEIENVPCLVDHDGDLYKLAIEDNIAENTYAPIDMFDWLDIIKQLKGQELTQEQIADKLSWNTKQQVSLYYKILEISTQVLDFCKRHQSDRVDKKSTSVDFDFTEGWFRTSGLYGLNPFYQMDFMRSFFQQYKKNKKFWANQYIKQVTDKYKTWTEYIECAKEKLFDLNNLPALIKIIHNDTFKKKSALLNRIESFNKESMNKIILGDAVIQLDKLEDASIDLVITDPPYGQGYYCWGDSSTDYVGYEGVINDTEDAFIILEKVCEILNRKTKHDCHLYFFCSWKVEPKFREIIGKYYEIKNIITWYKGNDGAGDLTYNWGDSTEFIIYAIKGKRPLNKGNRKLNHLSIPRLDHTKRIHPTQKPIKLIKEILEVSCQSADVVCDPFMGSGAVIKAIKEYNKSVNYIGIELDKDIFEKAKAFIGD